MFPKNPNNLTTVGPENYKTTDKDHKTEFMNVIEVLKEEMNKSLKEIYEKRCWKEIIKTVLGLKMEIESIKKTQTEGTLKKKKKGI